MDKHRSSLIFEYRWEYSGNFYNEGFSTVNKMEAKIINVQRILFARQLYRDNYLLSKRGTQNFLTPAEAPTLHSQELRS